MSNTKADKTQVSDLSQIWMMRAIHWDVDKAETFILKGTCYVSCLCVQRCVSPEIPADSGSVRPPLLNL